MKKSILFLSLVSTVLLNGCNNNKVDTSKIALDYGNVHSTNLTTDDLDYIDYDEFESYLTDKKSFVLVTTSEVSYEGCGCWKDFVKYCFIPYSNLYHYDFKIIHISELKDKNRHGIYIADGMMPGICFFRRGKLIRQSVYGKNAEKDRKIFNDFTTFEKFMADNVYLPKMYYLDKDVLDSKIASNEQFNLYIGRSGCDDCKYVEKTYIHSWVDKNKELAVENYLYAFDIEKYRPTVPKTDEDYPAQQEAYLNIKRTYKLTEDSNAKFGFGEGAVPTFQVWKNGDIYDMITVLNDSLNSETNRLSSYFTTERVANSPMLKDTGTTFVFDNMIVEEKDISTKSYVNPETGETITFKYVSRETQYAEWHEPVIEMYFNEYVK